MTAQLPSPDNGYHIPIDQRANREFFQLVFSSIHDRLVASEGREIAYEEAIQWITSQALLIITESISPEVEAQRQILQQIQAQAEELLHEYDTRQMPAGRVVLDDIEGLAAGTAQAAIALLVQRLATVTGEVGQSLTELSQHVFSMLDHQSETIDGSLADIAVALSGKAERTLSNVQAVLTQNLNGSLSGLFVQASAATAQVAVGWPVNGMSGITLALNPGMITGNMQLHFGRGGRLFNRWSHANESADFEAEWLEIARVPVGAVTWTNVNLPAPAQFSSSQEVDQTNFPIGQILIVYTASDLVDRRSRITPRLGTPSFPYTTTGTEPVLSGAWAVCGVVRNNAVNGSSNVYAVLAQRVS